MSAAADDQAAPQQRVDRESLTSWLARVFDACGMPEDDSRLAAEVMARCNARGYETHGVTRVMTYVQKFESGDINPNPNMTFEMRDAVLVIDGDDGLGQVVGPKAMDRAIELAHDTAFVPCFIRDGGHLGAIGMFPLRAAEAGMVSVLMQATSPVMSLPGSQGRAIGNNPISFATPVAGRDPLIFDMATCVTSRGRVLMANRAGRDIPEGWAIGPDGEPTTDAEQALLGAMLPVGGPKGIGLAMMVECLAASLSGTFAPAMQGAQPAIGSATMHVGAFFFVANPERVVGRDTFERHIDGWVSQYLSATGDDARLPGQRAAATERERTANGIPIPPEIIAELREVGDKVGESFDVPLT
ncbi:MAG: lactate dehydrogenase [Alphaproteobacteria bacterium]|nr:lactate dehydrogenase [Alphaproteobacteria bacterium]